MKFTSPRDHGPRLGNSASRTTVQKVDDTKIIQQKTLNGFADESMEQIEHFHDYGFTNVVQPPTGEGDNAQTAESMSLFMGSNRSHGVSIKNGDRRYRLYKLQNGEVALHDDQGQQVHFQRDGIWTSAPNNKKIVHQIMDDDALPQDDVETVNGTKLGQNKQAGRPAQISMTLTKDSWTVNHPKAITFNCATFTVNATADIKLIAAANALLKGAAAILYATGNAFVKAVANVNVKGTATLVDPPWNTGASDPPISS